MVSAILGRPDVPSDNKRRELWRAVHADRGPALLSDCGSDFVAAVARLATSSRDPASANVAFEQAAAKSVTMSLFHDVARRALVRASMAGGGAAEFAAQFFGEATSYYVARDISGMIGSPANVGTAGDAVRLRKDVAAAVQAVVRRLGKPSTSAAGWSRYVAKVVDALSQ